MTKVSARSLRLLCLTVLCVGICGCSRFIKVPKDHQQAFLFGVEQQQAGRYALSASATWKYIKEGGEEDPRYDRALRLMARNAEMMTLTYVASLWYLEIARGRRDAALIPEAIEGLKRLIESGPYDEDTLINYFLAVEEFPKLNSELDSFIHYQQGLHDLRQGLDVWAQRRFKMIHPKSPYRYHARYVSAVRLVALGQLSEATTSFNQLLKELQKGEELTKKREEELARQNLNLVWRDTMTSLARLAMQRGDEVKGLSFFERVREQVPDQPELLLEIAWAHYHQGDLRRALGYLLALDAPVYQELIAPERYILEAMTLRSLCQFGPARQAATRLHARYRQSLADLYEGVPLEQSQAMRAAASLRGELRPLSLFIERLKTEKKTLIQHSAQLGTELTQTLLGLYQRGISGAISRREGVLRTEVDLLARELLNAEEGVRLISHELGVALLRGRKPPKGRGPVAPVGEIASEGQVIFKFNGEFWTDELDELVVAAEDRCIDQ